MTPISAPGQWSSSIGRESHSRIRSGRCESSRVESAIRVVYLETMNPRVRGADEEPVVFEFDGEEAGNDDDGRQDSETEGAVSLVALTPATCIQVEAHTVFSELLYCIPSQSTPRHPQCRCYRGYLHLTFPGSPLCISTEYSTGAGRLAIPIPTYVRTLGTQSATSKIRISIDIRQQDKGGSIIIHVHVNINQTHSPAKQLRDAILHPVSLGSARSPAVECIVRKGFVNIQSGDLGTYCLDMQPQYGPPQTAASDSFAFAALVAPNNDVPETDVCC
ncbi:hypothetical protein F4802DRAFT_82913 [Xylaria palmicola]|nr:hypothetical protein F4802DRAFT_82913 [Xylaria palmicola]